MQRWPVLARQCCQTCESWKFSARSGIRGDNMQRTRLNAKVTVALGSEISAVTVCRAFGSYVGTNKIKRWSCYHEQALGRTRGCLVEAGGLCLARLREPYGRLLHQCEADALAQKYSVVKVIISQITRGSSGALDLREGQ